MKSPFFTLMIVAAISFIATVHAQPPGGGRGGPPPGTNQWNLGNQDQQLGNQFGIQAVQNQNINQNMPTIEQLAQMMVTNFDADGSSELSQAELRRALTALRQMMQHQAGG